MQELWCLCSACRLMLIDIYMKFREDSLNGFQVIERTQFCESPREALWFLCSAGHLMLIDIYMMFCEDSLNGFQVIVDTIFWQCPREITEKV